MQQLLLMAYPQCSNPRLHPPKFLLSNILWSYASINGWANWWDQSPHSPRVDFTTIPRSKQDAPHCLWGNRHTVLNLSIGDLIAGNTGISTGSANQDHMAPHPAFPWKDPASQGTIVCAGIRHQTDDPRLLSAKSKEKEWAIPFGEETAGKWKNRLERFCI